MLRKELKEDKFVDSVDKTVAFLKKREKSVYRVLAGLAGVALILAGVNVYLKQRKLEAMELLTKGKAAYEAGKYDDALGVLAEVSRKYRNTRIAEEAAIYTAESLCRLGKLNEGEVSFNDYLTWYPEGEFCDMAQSGLGYVMEQKGEFQKAVEAYRRVYHSYPGSHLSPQAMLGEARSYEAMGMWEEAKKCYESLISTYPWSSPVSLAKAYLEVVDWEIKEKQKK